MVFLLRNKALRKIHLLEKFKPEVDMHFKRASNSAANPNELYISIDHVSEKKL